MRRIFLLTISFAITALVYAQTPNTISFQGSLNNFGSTTPVADGNYDITFELFDDVNNSLWTETQLGVPVTNGLINVQLGSVTALEIDDFYQALQLEITIGTETLTPRIALSTVPFAQSAKAVIGTDSIVFRLANQKAGIVDQTNTALGFGSFTSEQGTGFFNEAIGTRSLNSNNGGSQNVAIGSYALESNTTGNTNIAIGYEALNVSSTSRDNIAIGPFALRSNTDGIENVGVGRDALMDNTTGGLNTAVGSNSMEANISGERNVAVGYNSLFSNTTGNQNTALGDGAQALNTTGFQNTAVGAAALLNNTIGTRNTAMGIGALGANLTTSENTAIGASALEASQGIGNTAIGSGALNGQTFGELNVAVGYNAGAGDVGVVQENGTFNTLIGPEANVGVDNLVNATAIGFQAVVSQDNSMVLGNNNVNVGIGTSAPAEKLSVNGNIAASGSIRSDSYEYLTPKTNYYFMSGLDFKIAVHTSSSTQYLTGYDRRSLIGGTAGIGLFVVAPFNLPDGATITEISFYLYDADATYDITDLRVYSNGTTGGYPVSGLFNGTSPGATSGSSGNQTITSSGLSIPVNNTNQGFWLYAFLRQPSSSTLLGIYGARITYTTLEP